MFFHVYFCVYISIYIYMCVCVFIYIFMHASPKLEIFQGFSRCFPSCSFFTEGPRALQFQEVLRQILDLKDETPEVALRIRRGTCQTFPQQIESYQVNCFFGGIFLWETVRKEVLKEVMITFSGIVPVFICFVVFVWFFSQVGVCFRWWFFPKHPLRGTVSKLWRCSTEITVKKQNETWEFDCLVYRFLVKL